MISEITRPVRRDEGPRGSRAAATLRRGLKPNSNNRSRTPANDPCRAALLQIVKRAAYEEQLVRMASQKNAVYKTRPIALVVNAYVGGSAFFTRICVGSG